MPTLCLILVMILTLVHSPMGWAATRSDRTTLARTTTITLLHYNDVYELSPHNKNDLGGVARATALAHGIRAQTPNTLLLHAGDFLFPSVASHIFKGSHMIHAMNLMGFDLVTLGNHEFDDGPITTRARMAESTFPYIATNVVDRASGRIFGGALSTHIIEVAGFKLGFFSILTPETRQLSFVGPDVDILEPIPTAKRAVQALKYAGADVIIALTHQRTGPEADEDAALAHAVPQIDAIIGGHDHNLGAYQVGTTVIAKAGTEMQHLGVLKLNLERGSEGAAAVRAVSWTALPVDQSIKPHPVVEELVTRIEDELATNLISHIATLSTSVDARRASLTVAESGLGNLIADTHRAAVHADIAISLAGRVRSERIIPAGVITKRDVIQFLGFNDLIMPVRMTGLVLRRTLEHCLSRLGRDNTRFPFLSGAQMTYDPTHAPGSRVVALRVNGSEVLDSDSFVVSLDYYTLMGGDGFDFTNGVTWLTSEAGGVAALPYFLDAWQNKILTPSAQGRVVNCQDLLKPI